MTEYFDSMDDVTLCPHGKIPGVDDCAVPCARCGHPCEDHATYDGNPHLGIEPVTSCDHDGGRLCRCQPEPAPKCNCPAWVEPTANV